jgi:hypothetical protein
MRTLLWHSQWSITGNAKREEGNLLVLDLVMILSDLLPGGREPERHTYAVCHYTNAWHYHVALSLNQTNGEMWSEGSSSQQQYTITVVVADKHKHSIQNDTAESNTGAKFNFESQAICRGSIWWIDPRLYCFRLPLLYMRIYTLE